MEFADWDAARAEASRLEELWLLANEERFDALLTVGRHEESLADLVSLAAEHPFRDRTRALLMTALYRAGRQPEALQAYQDHRRHLADELGLDPSPALRDLERSMLDHTLDVPRPRHEAVGSTASVLPTRPPGSSAATVCGRAPRDPRHGTYRHDHRSGWGRQDALAVELARRSQATASRAVSTVSTMSRSASWRRWGAATRSSPR